MTTERAARDKLATERLIIGMRWLLALYGVFQVAVDEAHFDRGFLAGAYSLLAVLLAGNVVFAIAVGRVRSDRELRRLGVSATVFDLGLVIGILALYASDPYSSLWALLFLIPLEGAARFQMRGALWSWAGVTVLYVLEALWAEATYGYEVRLDSLTYRMGLGLLIAVFVGRLAGQLHDQKAELLAALGRVERIDAWRSRLVQMLAHDLRSPLGSIDGTSELLLSRQDELEPDQVRQLLRGIRRQSARVQYLAHDLLDLARNESERLELTRERFDLAAFVRDTTPLVAHEGEEVHLEAPRALEVVADRQRLGQVYANLLGNALRHGRPPVGVRLSEDRGRVELAVTDVGQGVPPDRESRLFAAFGHGQASGSVGLGLWMSRLLVEAHGGDLRYVRDDAAGRTTFVAGFPRVTGPVEGEEEPGDGG